MCRFIEVRSQELGGKGKNCKTANVVFFENTDSMRPVIYTQRGKGFFQAFINGVITPKQWDVTLKSCETQM